MTTTPAATQLAIDGGKPAITALLPGSLQGVLDIDQKEIDAVTKVLKSKRIFRFLNKPEDSESAQLEQCFCRLCDVKYALATSGGTTSLIAALVGIGIGSGDEVIVPGYTYIATAAACLTVGAIPILAEIDETLTISVDDIAKRITPYTRAIIPVHMRGSICDMDAINQLAKQHNLKVLEDCAQANGGRYHGRAVGGLGDVGAFSLQHFKVITAGEGGMVTTNDTNIFRRSAIRHDSAMHFWREEEVWETFAGENFRMDEMRAALGLVQFGRMAGILEKCRYAKAALRRQTAKLTHLIPQKQHCSKGDCGTIFVVYLKNAAAAQRFSQALAAEGVPNATVYNKQIPDRHIYAMWDYVMEKHTHDHTGWPWTAAHRPIEYHKQMLPQTLDILGRCISIGLNQHWQDEHIDAVAGAFAKVHDELARRGKI